MAISLIKSDSGCTFSPGKTILCESLNLSISEPIQNEAVIEYGNITEVLQLSISEGSIGVKTLSTFPEVELLYVTLCEIKDIEKGALCSLPKLKTLGLSYNQFPLLTKEHFSGCSHLEGLEYEQLSPEDYLEENALEDMTGLKKLQLSTPKYSKAYIAHLKELTNLVVETRGFLKLEPGLFCLPTLEVLIFVTELQTEITESLFEGCNSIKHIYSHPLSKGIIPEGQNPFSNLTHLESLRLQEIDIIHLTKDFLSGLPNLKSFTFVKYPMKKISFDYNSFTGVPNLTELRFTGASFNETDLEKLYFPTNLEHLTLQYNEFKNIDVLKSLPKLRTLSLMNNKIQRFDLAALKKNFPKLGTVTLYGNPLDMNFAKELMKEKTLKFEIS